jgi:hypothetical protein
MGYNRHRRDLQEFGAKIVPQRRGQNERRIVQYKMILKIGLFQCKMFLKSRVCHAGWMDSHGPQLRPPRLFMLKLSARILYRADAPLRGNLDRSIDMIAP